MSWRMPCACTLLSWGGTRTRTHKCVQTHAQLIVIARALLSSSLPLSRSLCHLSLACSLSLSLPLSLPPSPFLCWHICAEKSAGAPVFAVTDTQALQSCDALLVYCRGPALARRRRVKLACTHLGLVPSAVAPRRTRAIITTTIPPSSSSCGPHAGVACRRHNRQNTRHGMLRGSCAWQMHPPRSHRCTHPTTRAFVVVFSRSYTAPELTKAVTIPAPKPPPSSLFVEHVANRRELDMDQMKFPLMPRGPPTQPDVGALRAMLAQPGSNSEEFSLK